MNTEKRTNVLPHSHSKNTPFRYRVPDVVIPQNYPPTQVFVFIHKLRVPQVLFQPTPLIREIKERGF